MYDLGRQFHIDLNKLKSKSNAIITGANYRFTILSERLIRLEYSKDGKFNDYATEMVNFRDFDVPNFDVKQDNRMLEISTSYFKLSYIKNAPFKNIKNLKVLLNGTDKIWYYGHPEIRNYFGNHLNLSSPNTSSVNKGLYSLEGFVSFDDSYTFRLDQNGTIMNANKDNLDIYLFMYNRDFGYCMSDYFKLTGNPSLIPRYALGNWWCRDKVYSENDILNTINDFKRSNIPLSIFLLDKQWHINEYGKYKDLETGFTFNNKYFSNPKLLIDNLHYNGIKLGLKVNPKQGIMPYEANYNEAIKYLQVKPGHSIRFEPFNPRFLDVYFKLFLHPLENIGVDFFWNDYDNNKDSYSTWVMNHYHYFDLEKNYAKRGMTLGRNSLIAPHRYPVLYSEKTKVSWDNFKLIPFYNLSASNIGVSWWSHDIGGYSEGIEEAELYIRSVQLGVYSPILRFHSAGGKYYKREPWRWDKKTYEIVSDYLRLRHRLIPYLYTEAYKYHKNGSLIFQPLYYLVPKLYDDLIYRNEYFFGSELLVAPIINKKEPIMNRTIHKFYLPEGMWYDFRTGKKFVGNRKYTSFYKEEDYPVFAKRGSIIPLSNKSNESNTSNPTELEIHVFPGENNTYELYEDDGVSSYYKQGYFLKTMIDYNYLPNNYTLIIRSMEGKSGIAPDNRSYKIRFRNTKHASDVIVRFNSTIIESNNYIDGTDFIVEVKNIPTLGQLTINCKGNDIEIDAVRLINEDIDEILSDLQIETVLKENIANVIFSDLPINKKRIAIRKLKRKGLDKSFITLFLKLLEYIEYI